MKWIIRDPPPVSNLLERLIGEPGKKLFDEFDSLQELARASPEELKPYLTPARVRKLTAAIKLHHAISAETIETAPHLNSATAVFELYRDRFKDEPQEHFIALLLNAKNRVMKEVLVSVGSLTASVVHPREVFAPAIKERAASILVLHNHPSGDSSPSREDIDITKRLKKAGEIIGIQLLDHVIIASDYFSFKERRLL